MVILRVSGKYIERFIKRLHDNGINLYRIKKIDRVTVLIYVLKNDVDHVNELKTIYDIEVIGYTGFLRFKDLILRNIVLISCMVIGIVFFIFLSNLVFDINIVINDSDVRNIIYSELDKNGIKKYSFKKSYDELDSIRNDIVFNYRDSIEWLSIEYSGVSCIVRVVKRIKNEEGVDNPKRHIVAKKDSIIRELDINSGVIMKDKDTFVNKGEIIVSGNVMLNDEVKDTVSAEGNVYGEVWYTVRVDYPLTYYEEKLNGKDKKGYSLKFFNFNFDLFKKKNVRVVKNKIFDFKYIGLYKNDLIGYDIIDEVYSYDEAVIKAMDVGREKIISKLKDKEYIIFEKCLKVSLEDSRIVLDIFYSVCEDITDYLIMEETDDTG